jgi:ketosteroid isomerase-like protein
MKAVETKEEATKNKEIVGKVNDAFAENRPEDFLSFCSEDVRWTIIGDKTCNGKDAIREFMSSMEGMAPPTFTVDTIVAEGDSVVAHGDMKMAGKDGTVEPYSYCDIYGFRDGKISELSSFVVKTPN